MVLHHLNVSGRATQPFASPEARAACRNRVPLTLPEACAGGFFVHPTRLRRALANTARPGGLSRSDVFRRSGTRSHLPGGTERGRSRQGSSQNIEGRIMVSVQDQSTGRAHMGTLTQALLHAIPATRTILRREARRDGDDGHISSRAIVADVRRGRGPNWHH